MSPTSPSAGTRVILTAALLLPAAAAAGWRSEPDPATVEDACWTRTKRGRHLLLDVDLRPRGFSPDPEAGTGLAYSVSVGSERDGGKETCRH